MLQILSNCGKEAMIGQWCLVIQQSLEMKENRVYTLTINVSAFIDEITEDKSGRPCF